MKPKDIRHLISSVGRIPAERNTKYKILQTFENEIEEKGLDIAQDSQFGTYFELVKINKFRYKNPRRE